MWYKHGPECSGAVDDSANLTTQWVFQLEKIRITERSMKPKVLMIHHPLGIMFPMFVHFLSMKACSFCTNHTFIRNSFPWLLWGTKAPAFVQFVSFQLCYSECLIYSDLPASIQHQQLFVSNDKEGNSMNQLTAAICGFPLYPLDGMMSLSPKSSYSTLL